MEEPPIVRRARLADAPNLNRLWADLMVEELVRCGVEMFCLAPGSRSGPLVTAVAAHPTAQRLMHFDERGTAFAALGWARATGRPACWITTSGTAVANGLPAVVEAASDGVPLIALTADRPPELRDSGANQTIDQPGIFGRFARWQVDLPVPTAAIDPAFVLTTIDQAVHRALHPRGPVHVNVMFREPLAPEPDGTSFPKLPRRWIGGKEPFTSYRAAGQADAGEVADLAQRLARAPRGIIVAGRLHSRREAEAARRLAERLRWPLLPDACSQLRLAGDDGVCIPHFDLVLGSDAFLETHVPDAVLYLGAPATSRRLTAFLIARPVELFAVVRDDPFRFDPEHRVTHRFQVDVARFCDAVSDLVPSPTDDGWLASWRSASEAASTAAGAFLDRLRDVNEPGVARTLSRHLTGDHLVVLGSSMPIRDFDTFAECTGARPLVVANRGASGIDGIVATAAGAARGLQRPAVLLTGDLALLHDLNSLALLRERGQPPVVIVALNNDGCGIFHFLPIAEHADVFETHFGTPHGMTLGHAAAQFGLQYEAPEDPSDFDQALVRALAAGHSCLIEIRTERAANRALHDELRATAGEAVSSTMMHHA